MSTRKIPKSKNYEQYRKIVELIIGIKDGLESMSKSYNHYFSESEIKDIGNKLEIVKKLIGNELLRLEELPWDYLSKLFDDEKRMTQLKKNADIIFKIEDECKEYASRIWAGEITKIEDFDTTKPFKLLVNGFYESSLYNEKVADRKIRIFRENKIKHLSTSLITNNFLGIFGGSYYGFAYDVDEKSYLAAYERDAESGYFKTNGNSTSSFEKEMHPGTLKIEEDDFIACNEPAVITKTPDFIENICAEKYYVEEDSRYHYNEIVLDRRHSKPVAVFCIIFGNKMISQSYIKAKAIADELNLPIICIDKLRLCEKSKLLKISSRDTYEICNGLKMNLDYKTVKELEDLIFSIERGDHIDNKVSAYMRAFKNIKEKPNSDIIKSLHKEINKKIDQLKSKQERQERKRMEKQKQKREAAVGMEF